MLLSSLPLTPSSCIPLRRHPFFPSLFFIFVFGFYSLEGLNNGVGLHPPKGFSSWNAFGNTDLFNESAIRAQADALVRYNLSQYYKYINLDCGWSLPNRSPEGNLIPNPQRFPSGLANLSAYVRSLGLELGIYTEHFLTDCCGNPGMYGYEDIDANYFKNLSISYVKIDSCAGHELSPQQQYDNYLEIAQALNRTGHPFYVSTCPTAYNPPAVNPPCVPWGGNLSYSSYGWTNNTYEGYLDPFMVSNAVLVEFCNAANSYDTTVQIIDAQQALIQNDYYYSTTGPGNWIDMDMLTVGCSDAPHPGTPCAPQNGDGTSMTYDEQVSQFSIWAIMSSPLILGSDLRFVSSQTLSIIGNTEVIAMNDDPLGYKARLVYDVSSSIPKDSPPVYLAPCNDQDTNQYWNFSTDGSIVSVATDNCLDVWNCETADGTVVDLYACHVNVPACNNSTGSPNQVWTVNPTTTGVAYVTGTATTGNLVSALNHTACLSALRTSSDPRINLYASYIDTCSTEATNQQWNIFSAPDQPAYTIIQSIAYSTLCLSSSPPQTVQIYAKLMNDTSRSVALLNRGMVGTNITVLWSDITLGVGNVWTNAAVRDLWKHTDEGIFTDSFTMHVNAHGVGLLRIQESNR